MVYIKFRAMWRLLSSDVWFILYVLYLTKELKNLDKKDEEMESIKDQQNIKISRQDPGNGPESKSVVRPGLTKFTVYICIHEEKNRKRQVLRL